MAQPCRFEFENDRGHKLHGVEFLPSGKQWATLIWNHGVCEHKERYVPGKVALDLIKTQKWTCSAVATPVELNLGFLMVTLAQLPALGLLLQCLSNWPMQEWLCTALMCTGMVNQSPNSLTIVA
jgi:hypothetical protein